MTETTNILFIYKNLPLYTIARKNICLPKTITNNCHKMEGFYENKGEGNA